MDPGTFILFLNEYQFSQSDPTDGRGRCVSSDLEYFFLLYFFLQNLIKAGEVF